MWLRAQWLKTRALLFDDSKSSFFCVLFVLQFNFFHNFFSHILVWYVGNYVHYSMFVYLKYDDLEFVKIL